jgi:hypothetical protein
MINIFGSNLLHYAIEFNPDAVIAKSLIDSGIDISKIPLILLY